VANIRHTHGGLNEKSRQPRLAIIPVRVHRLRRQLHD